MAQMSMPNWEPAQVKALPAETTVAFNVKPGKKAVATKVQYVLKSPRLEFIAPDAGLIRPQEAKVSTPAPSPSRREGLVVEDDYSGLPASSTTPIVRGLGIEQFGTVAPGLATIIVSVFDVLESGELVGTDSRVAQISFAL